MAPVVEPVARERRRRMDCPNLAALTSSPEFAAVGTVEVLARCVGEPLEYVVVRAGAVPVLVERASVALRPRSLACPDRVERGHFGHWNRRAKELSLRARPTADAREEHTGCWFFASAFDRFPVGVEVDATSTVVGTRNSNNVQAYFSRGREAFTSSANPRHQDSARSVDGRVRRARHACE